MKKLDYELIELPKITDPRGNLTVAEQMKNVPFDIKRVYWTYDVPGGHRTSGFSRLHFADGMLSFATVDRDSVYTYRYDPAAEELCQSRLRDVKILRRFAESLKFGDCQKVSGFSAVHYNLRK